MKRIFLVRLLIWSRGVVITLGDQPEHRRPQDPDPLGRRFLAI